MEYCGNKEKFKDLTLEEIEFNIKERRSLINQMIGSLYPRVLADEIITLQEIRHGRYTKKSSET